MTKLGEKCQNAVYLKGKDDDVRVSRIFEFQG